MVEKNTLSVPCVWITKLRTGLLQDGRYLRLFKIIYYYFSPNNYLWDIENNMTVQIAGTHTFGDAFNRQIFPGNIQRTCCIFFLSQAVHCVTHLEGFLMCPKKNLSILKYLQTLMLPQEVVYKITCHFNVP